MGGAAADGAGARAIDPSLPVPSLRLPQNGRGTGSVWAERARRPRFVWEQQAAVSFEVQVDDSCAAGQLQSCDFASPEWTAAGLTSNEVTPATALPVSDAAPVGRRYYWRVQACGSKACSLWSQVRYVDVGRQPSDFNGDGFSDVVVADQGSSARQGRVLIGFGPLPSSRPVVIADAVAAETEDRFGQVARALGDVDADGFADLLVTAPGNQHAVPWVAYVYFGSATFAEASSRQRLLLQANEPGGAMAGAAIPAGDVDADGRQDFVIDFYPGATLYRSLGRSMSTTPLSVIQSGKYLQHSSAGDVTGDGYSDLLVVSASRNGNSSARYDLLRGSTLGLDDPVDPSSPAGDATAWWVVTGDVNGDGFSDLGSTFNYWNEPSASRIDVTWGAESPGLDERAITWAGGITGSSVELGRASAAGDVNADGFEDSLVGVAWHSSDLVQANLYLGGLGSRSAPDASYAFQAGLALFVSQGLPSAPGDVNGDGFDDVLLGEDYAATAQLFFGDTDLDTISDDRVVLPPP
jgi:hypothetical protein